MSVAFVFPGQGSQSVGMMAAYESLPAVRETFVEASEALGQNLWALAAQGPVDALNQTVNTQPLMLAAGMAVYRAWRATTGPDPVMVAGHSLGEYTALVVAGVVGFREALQLVRFRAQIMQEAVPEGTGGMAALLGLDDEAVRKVCAQAAQGEVLETVNFNAPGQVVIAGHTQAVQRGVELAKQSGAKRAVILPVSVPSHCSLLRDASERLRERLAGVKLTPPTIPMLNNVDVAARDDPAQIADALVRQLYNPVRWVESIQELARRNITWVVECGPGGVLNGLNKRIAPQMNFATLKDAASVLASATEIRIPNQTR